MDNRREAKAERLAQRMRAAKGYEAYEGDLAWYLRTMPISGFNELMKRYPEGNNGQYDRH